MPIEFEEIDCNIFGDLKVADNAAYNATLLSTLVEANEGSSFNKPIVLQAASMIEAATIQIFYRAARYTIEGVPNITEADRREIAARQIDKFAVVIDNLRKYDILDGLGADIYEKLHKLRKYRNKIHIQLDIEIPGVSRDEDRQFTNELANWAINLNWKVLNHLAGRYPRPADIGEYVPSLRLPRLT